jgi:MFS superfamily sulfate permease-like transporter
MLITVQQQKKKMLRNNKFKPCTLSAIACFAVDLTFASGVMAAIVASFVAFALYVKQQSKQ